MSNYLKQFKRKNLKKAGQLDETDEKTHDPPKGRNKLKKFINANRRAAGLEQK